MNLAVNTIKIEVPDFYSDQPESYCRFCYSETELVSIFSAKDVCQRIVGLMNELADTRLSVLEDFPSAICRQCQSKLDEFDRFRQKCKVYSDAIKQRRIEYTANYSAEVKNEVISDQEDHFEIEQDHSNACIKKELPIVGESSLSPGYGNQMKRKITTNRGSLLAKLIKMNKHSVSKSNKRRTEQQDYRCKICQSFFTDKESINFHMKKHIDTVNLCCCHCSKTSESILGLMSHAIKSYTLSSFPCKHCDVHFKSKEKLFSHEFYCEKGYSEEKPQTVLETPKAAQCSMCPKSYDSIRKLQVHMMVHDAKFNCKKCGADLPTAKHLKNHDDRYHAPGTKVVASTVKCEPCQRVFVDASAYRSHHTGIHGKQIDQTSRKLEEEKLYECDICGKRFWSINTIRYHVLVHRQYRDCDQCSESFRSRQELRDHKMAEHPVVCDFCPLKFFSEQSRRSHCTKMHGMLHVKQLANDGSGKVTYSWRKITYKCASCEQDYEQYGQLKDHYHRMHSECKLLIKCNYCNKSSTSRIGYVGHLIGNCGQTPRRMR